MQELNHKIEFQNQLKALGHEADKIAAIWHKSSNEVLVYVRARMLFAVLCATNLCICGSRVKRR